MGEKILRQSLDDIMGDRFGKYSKYIIQDRALPDVRDGLKPVQRRILYAMYKEGNTHTKPYRKSAKTVGNVIGNYHPHGDSSVYEAMVRLSQDWKMRIPLIDMQGNNGSIDNDPAAAMRYTEARLAPISLELLKDLDKETVLMALNFDDTEYEPTVLPAKYPNLLVNGATGISAGYATDIPPHNLEEVIDATIYRINHPRCNLDDLMEYMKGPDFPTGAIVEGKKGIRDAFETGKGKVVVRSKSEIIEEKTMNKIVITEIPFEVNKAELVRKLDEIRFNKNVDGIIEVRDESDRKGLSIVVELKKDVDVQNTLNYFYKNTDLQKNYNYNMVAIKDKRPVCMGIVDIIDGYIKHSIEVITKRSLFELNKAEERKHIVEGLIKAVSILDEVVHTIRKSLNKSDAKINLQDKFGFTEKQSEAIVMLQLYRLTNTDIVSLEKENQELNETIDMLNSILSSDKVLRKVITNELKLIKKQYPTPRLTQIKDEVLEVVVNEDAMILPEDVYVSITRDGYIKRISKKSYTASLNTPIGKKEEDSLVDLHFANTLDKLLVFTDKGNYMYIPVHKLEEFRWKELGKHISYMIKISPDEKIISSLLVKSFDESLYVILASKNGQIKRVKLNDFELTRYTKPVKCINLKDDDVLVGVKLTNGNQAVILSTYCNYATLYDENEVSILGVKAAGIRGIKLKDDYVVSLNVFDPSMAMSFVMISDSMGIKRMHVSDITTCSRATKGTQFCKSLKTKEIHTMNTFVLDTKDQFVIDVADESIVFNVKDFNYNSLETKPSIPSSLKDKQFVRAYLNKTMITSMYDTDLNQPKKIVEKKTQTNEKTKTIEKKPSKETMFEPISFDDLFNIDF